MFVIGNGTRYYITLLFFNITNRMPDPSSNRRKHKNRPQAYLGNHVRLPYEIVELFLLFD
jgi:hypothetical protein